MAEENVSIDNQESTFEILLNKVKQGSKPLAALSATIYVIGYIVTSFHLAQYGVPIKSFIDAQYFAAGLLPGVLLWFTAYVIISAWNFYPRTGEIKTVKRSWWFANILAVASIVVIMMYREIVFSKLIPVGLMFIFPLGELSLWILIVIFRKEFKYWLDKIKPIALLHEGYKKISVGTFMKTMESLGKIYLIAYLSLFLLVLIFFYFVFLIYFSFFALVIVPFSGPMAYEQLPQAYGGGKLQPVQLYVDSQKVPFELLDANVSLAQGLPARAIPLNLIYQTSTEYIVINQSDHRVWQLKADAVYAVVENP